MEEGERTLAEAVRNELAAELSRRDFISRAGGLGLGAVVLGALPVLERMATPDPALAQGPDDATMQAFFDTIIPGRKVSQTQSGQPIDPKAIAGVDPEPGAVEADAVLLAHHPKIGFDPLEPAFLAELETFSVTQGGDFLHLDYDHRQAACVQGLDFSNPTRPVWEAAAAVAFTAFCGAATIKNATAAKAVGYRVMGFPGTAPHGHRGFSYRRRLNHGRTRKGYLP